MQPCHHDFWCKVFGDRNFSSSDSWPGHVEIQHHEADVAFSDTLIPWHHPPKWRGIIWKGDVTLLLKDTWILGYLCQISGGIIIYQKGAAARENPSFLVVWVWLDRQKGAVISTFHMASFHMSNSSMQNFGTNNSWKFNIAPRNIPYQKERIVFQSHHFSGVNSLLNFATCKTFHVSNWSVSKSFWTGNGVLTMRKLSKPATWTFLPLRIWNGCNKKSEMITAP